MKAIWKYKIEIDDTQTLSIPADYEILTIQHQFSDLCMWVLVDPEIKKKAVMIDIYGTGHTISDLKHKYINTFQVNGGALVFHAFERI